MTKDDFPQFDDPRVRAVMAAAANLVEAHARDAEKILFHRLSVDKEVEVLKTALFAAQHSKAPPLHCECVQPLWVALSLAARVNGEWSWKRIADRAREYIADPPHCTSCSVKLKCFHGKTHAEVCVLCGPDGRPRYGDKKE